MKVIQARSINLNNRSQKSKIQPISGNCNPFAVQFEEGHISIGLRKYLPAVIGWVITSEAFKQARAHF